MQLSTCVVSSDENPFYLDFYPLTRRVWNELCGLRCVLVLIADRIPDALNSYVDDIVLCPPIDGVHPGFQAQCIRLLAPQLLGVGGGIVISDIDMLPMRRGYFVDSVSQVPDDAFVVYRADDRAKRTGEIPMCYNAASAGTWAELTGKVASVAEAGEMIARWHRGSSYSGVPGQDAWQTDQKLLFGFVKAFDSDRIRSLHDWATRFHRLSRPYPGVSPNRLELALIRTGWYADFHMGRPMSRFGEINEEIAQAVLEGGHIPGPLAGFLGLSVVRRIYAAQVRRRGRQN